MNHPFKPDQNDPMKVKRNFAIFAFWSLLGIVLNILWLVHTGDENTARNLSASQGILIVIFPILMTPITHYFYMTGQNKNDSSTRQNGN